MKVSVCEHVIIFVDYDVASVPTKDYDTNKLIKFLETLKSVPLWYNREMCMIERSTSDFVREAGTLGFVRYLRKDNGDAYYFSKGILFNQPVLILQTIQTYCPCACVYIYGDTTVEDLIDKIISELKNSDNICRR